MLQVEDLARLSFKRQPLYVGIDDSKAASTREGLEQGYCCVASDKRFLLLFTFLKKNANKKVCALGSRRKAGNVICTFCVTVSVTAVYIVGDDDL
jgi:superfamily II DNA/RNA helicase